MIDLNLMQSYIREANPILHVDDVDPDELATFVAAAHTRRAAIMQAPTRPPTPTVPVTSTPPRQRRRGWAFAAAFVLVVGAAGAVALVLRVGPGLVADEPTQPGTEATGVPAVESLQWSRVPDDPFAFRPMADDTIHSVTAYGSGFVAVGEIGWRAAVWLSSDGITWSLLPIDELPPEADGASWMRDVVVGGPGLVAVGSETPDQPLGAQAVIWTSEDGTSWTKIPAAELGSDDPDDPTFWLSDVTIGGPGLVAVGRAFNSTEPDPCGGCGGAVWTSVDGITWERAPVDPDLLDGIERVAANKSGLVAVGSGTTDDQKNGAAWVSPDGLSWTVVNDAPKLTAITATEFGFVGVGTEELIENACQEGAHGDCRAAVWTSVDGTTWTRVPHDEAIFGGGPDKQDMSDVTTIGSGVLAVGTSVWYSPNATTWTRIYQDPALTGEHNGHMHSVAVGDSAVVVAGADGGSYYQLEPSTDPRYPPVRTWQSAATPIVWVAPVPG
jgi:hypothetical protein